MGKIIYIVVAACLLQGCITVPDVKPLGFASRELVTVDNPAYSFDPCEKISVLQVLPESGVVSFRHDSVVCDREMFKSNLDDVTRQHYELLSYANANELMVDLARTHDRADSKRNAILQAELRELHWEVLGSMVGGVLVGFVGSLLLGVL